MTSVGNRLFWGSFISRNASEAICPVASFFTIINREIRGEAGLRLVLLWESLEPWNKAYWILGRFSEVFFNHSPLGVVFWFRRGGWNWTCGGNVCHSVFENKLRDFGPRVTCGFKLEIIQFQHITHSGPKELDPTYLCRVKLNLTYLNLASISSTSNLT